MLVFAAMVSAVPSWAQDDAAQDESIPAQSAADSGETGNQDSALPTGLTPPATLEERTPSYPPAALGDEVEADVVMQIDVTADGRVENIVPVGLTYYTYDAEGFLQEDARDLAADDFGFIPAAVEAMQGFVFQPATMVDEDGVAQPVPVQLTWRMGFVIDYEAVEVPVLPQPETEEGEVLTQINQEGPVNLEGRLLERGTRAPLPGFIVAVELPGAEGEEPLYAESVTDSDGRYAFRGLPAGEWRLVVNEADYFPFESDVSVSATEVTDSTYYVERNTYGENVATVTTTPVRQEVTRRTISVQEIQRIPGNNNDAIRVVQNLPGVARPAFGGGDVIIRGSAPEDTEFLIDGMGIPAVYHFGGLRAVFPSELLEEINFLPGGYSAYYGRATGGVVEVTTRQTRPERIGGHVDVNVFDTGVWLEAPIGDKVFVQLGSRRSYIDAVLLPLADALELNFTTAPRYYDAQARVVWDVNQNNRLSLLTFLSDDLLDLVRDDQTGIDPEQRGGIRARSYFNGAQLAWSSQITPTLRNEMRVQVYNQGLNFAIGQGLYFNLKTIEHAYRDTLTWSPTDRFTLRYGMDIRAFPGDIGVRAPQPPAEGQEGVGLSQAETLEVAEDFNFYQPAQFVEVDVVPVEGLSIRPGFRMEYYRPPQQWAFQPRLAARWQLNPTVLVKGAFGSFHQDPQPFETSDGFGNPDLRLEQAFHYVAGTELTLGSAVTANFELFYKDLNQLVSPSNETVQRNDETVAENYNNDGQGRIFGGEMLVRVNLDTRFSGWVAYTISRSERLDAGLEQWRLFDFDQTHILTILGSYNLPKNWSVGARFRLVSGNPDTPLLGGAFDVDSNSYVRVAGEANSVRQPPFHQLDVRVDKRWVYNRWMLNLYLDLQNAYNRRNQENVAYSYDFEDSAPITGLPIIPSFGIRAEF
jgi:hypothetical protein